MTHIWLNVAILLMLVAAMGMTRTEHQDERIY